MNNTSRPKEKKKQHSARHSDRPAKNEADADKPERIARRMARAGLCSRREAERWIADGRVVLNGRQLDTPAVTVTASDRVEVDGNLLGERERTRLWLFNKPTGCVTTNKDPEGRRTVFDILPAELPRLMTVGRLDINTEGLLLMTNDGGLARSLELPDTGWLRRYRVRVHGKVNQTDLDRLKDGVAVDGVLYGSIEASLEQEVGSNAWLNVALREGKNREIKKVMGSIGLEVARLIRISYGPFQLGDLPSGVIREVRSRTLREQLGAKLVADSGADFEGPIVHLAPQVARSAKRAAETAKPARQTSRDKAKPGVARQEMLDRLTTSPDKPDRKSGSRKGSSSKTRKPGRKR